MVKPREPPAVEKPHISDIGMMPQAFSPLSPSSCPPPSDFASPLLPRRSVSASRSSLASGTSLPKFEPLNQNLNQSFNQTDAKKVQPSSGSTLSVMIGSAKSIETAYTQKV